MTTDYASFFEQRADLCGGEPVLKGTRVTVRTVLASLAEGASIPEILADFPTLTEPAVGAVSAFAAASAEEDLPTPAADDPAHDDLHGHQCPWDRQETVAALIPMRLSSRL